MPKPMPTKAKMAGGFFEVMCDVAGRYRFHLKSANGQIIAVSQAYGTKESAQKGIASIQKNAPIAEIADLTTTEETNSELTHKPAIVREAAFEIKSDVAGKYRFHLKAANEEIVAAS